MPDLVLPDSTAPSARDSGSVRRTLLVLLVVAAALGSAAFWAITSLGPDESASSLSLEHESVDALLALPGGRSFLATTTGKAICRVEVVAEGAAYKLRSTVLATFPDAEPTDLDLAGEYVVVGDWDGSLWLWSLAGLLAKAPPLAQIEPSEEFEPVLAVAASPDGHFFAAAHATYWALYLLRPGPPSTDPLPGTVVTTADLSVIRARRYPDSAEYVEAIAWSPDGRTVAVGGDAGFELWRTDLDGEVARVDAASAGRSLEASELPATLEAPEPGATPAPSAAPRTEPRRFNTAVSAFAFSPDGRWLAVASVNQMPTLWWFDPRSGAASDPQPLPRTRFLRTRFYEEGAQGLAFTPAGDRLLVGFQDNSVHVYRIPASGPPVEESARRGHTVPVASLAVTTDGQFALTGSYEGLVKLWSLR